jgi:hypothetical protein
LLVTLPWFVAIGIATEGKFFQDAVGGDLGSKLAGASEAHGGPPGFHFLLAPLLLFPATIPVFLALPAAWRDRAAPATRFLLAWLIPAWIVFELVPTKLPHYVLPLYPALFLLAARWLLDPARLDPPRWLKRVASGAFLIAGALIGAGGFALAIALYRGALPASLLGMPALAAALMVLWLGGRAENFRRFLLAVLAMPLLTYSLLELEFPALQPLWITPRVSQALAAHWPKGRPAGSFATVGFAEPSLIFLSGTDTVLLRTGEDGAGFLAAGPDRVLLVSDRQLARFRDAAARIGITPRVLTQVAGINYSRGQWVELTLFTR